MSKYRPVPSSVPNRIPRTVDLTWLKHDEAPGEDTQRNPIMIRNSQEHISDLRASRGAVQATLQQMSVASAAAGEQRQAGMKVAWETMRKALEIVSADLRK